MAEITANKVIMSTFLFVLLALAGFSFYTGLLIDNEVSFSTSINNSTVQNFKIKAENISNTIQDEKDTNPPIFGLDIITTGFDAIKAIFGSIPLVHEFVSFMQEQTPLGRVPSVVWDIILAMIGVTIILIIIGVFWRYKTQG